MRQGEVTPESYCKDRKQGFTQLVAEFSGTSRHKGDHRVGVDISSSLGARARLWRSQDLPFLTSERTFLSEATGAP